MYLLLCFLFFSISSSVFLFFHPIPPPDRLAMQSPPLMAIDKIEDMELHREAWEDTLLGFDFWKDAFKWCKEIDDRKKAEQEADREGKSLFLARGRFILRYTSLSKPIAFSPKSTHPPSSCSACRVL
jgi:hypothetical protein